MNRIAFALVVAALVLGMGGPFAQVAAAPDPEVERLLRIARANATEEGAFAAREALRKVQSIEPEHAEAAELLKKIEPFLARANSIEMRLVRVPAGKFMMGSPKGQLGAREQQRPVTLTKGFWVGATEVTQRQFEEVMGFNPSLVKEGDLPVTNVTWRQAVEFCQKLSKKERKAYRLPREAEWEYACRAGTDGPWAAAKLDEVGWYRNNANRKLHPVATKAANAWGVHDMHGNVAEMCLDLLPARHDGSAVTDPAGPPVEEQRQKIVALRGGTFADPELACRSADLGSVRIEQESPAVGFRVVCEEDR